jgi:hypothetical protein
VKKLELTNSQALSILWAIELTRNTYEGYTLEELHQYGLTQEIKNLEFVKYLLED